MQDPQLLLSGKVCLVTGATGGIGEVAARALVRMGAHVIITGRTTERCQAVVERIAAENDDLPAAGSAEYHVADLSEMAQVRRLGEAVRTLHPRLDVLVNNVGGFYNSRELTAEGLELTWALNHLSYFLLTRLLLEPLKLAANEIGEARVVNVSSAAHRGAKIRFDDLQGERYYSGWRAYGQSKLANLLFTLELDRRLRGTGVSANALHPGFVATNLGGSNPKWWRVIMQMLHYFAATPEQGAATTIFLASDTSLRGVSGLYFVDGRPTAADPAVYDQKTARQLWAVSEEMVGES